MIVVWRVDYMRGGRVSWKGKIPIEERGNTKGGSMHEKKRSEFLQ